MTAFISKSEQEAIRYQLVDEDAAGDIAFWLYATAAYCAVRISAEKLFPGKLNGYTRQQYIVTLGHQAVILPLIGVGFALGLATGQASSTFSREGSSWVYLLTGAYMASDSVVNYSPVSGCIAGYEGPPLFSWSVHSHHFFTLVLCALGTTLPEWLEDEGAVAILLGEAGSLWITVTLLWPTPVNFILRFYAFFATRIAGSLIALDIARQLEWNSTRSLFVCMALGVMLDNCRTLGRMRQSAVAAAVVANR